MGSKQRAAELSQKLAVSLPFRKILRYILDKCGNCPFRVGCWSKLFSDIGHVIEGYRGVFNCDGHCVFDGRETPDGRQAVMLLNICANCEYLRTCISSILNSREFVGLAEATSDNVELHIAVVKRCSVCKDNIRCWSGILKALGINWTKKFGAFYRIIFKCKYEHGVEQYE